MFSLSEGGEASSFSLLLISRRRERYFASPLSLSLYEGLFSVCPTTSRLLMTRHTVALEACPYLVVQWVPLLLEEGGGGGEVTTAKRWIKSRLN